MKLDIKIVILFVLVFLVFETMVKINNLKNKENFFNKVDEINDGISIYINLLESVDRKESIENQVKLVGLSNIRCNAVKDEYGPLGCLKSHYKSISIAETLKDKYSWFLILEDDVVWSKNYTNIYINNQLKNIDIYLKHAPVVLLNGSAKNEELEDHPLLKDAKLANSNGAYAYIVRSDYLKVLKKEWEESIPKFEKQIINFKNKISNDKPLWWYNTDCFPWIDLQKKDKWIMLKNRIATTGFLVSTLENSLSTFQKKWGKVY